MWFPSCSLLVAFANRGGIFCGVDFQILRRPDLASQARVVKLLRHRKMAADVGWSNWMGCVFFLCTKPLKLTAKAPKNGWLEY